MSAWIDRPRRVKGSGDHDWAEWSETPPGRGRTCKDCGCEDDGYVQPCLGTVTPTAHEQTAHTQCAEPGCDRSPIDGHVLYRVNPKGQPGVFMCHEHASAEVAAQEGEG